MPASKEIVELVERFQRNRESYDDPQFNEAQTRIQFINPLFAALGWDVGNASGYAEAYKDVVHEDSLKIGGATKAPDYSFRIGGTRKFFVEAKKPSVNVQEAADAAYQLRRYAWSAKLPISILTNFAALVVYDCRQKPANDDRTSKGRVAIWKVEEYVEKWDEIAAIFSKASLLQGAFDRFTASRSTRGTAEVDSEFLAEIEGWRDALAKNIALRNRGIGTGELNFAVQQTIDRIVFLRICEDRGIEPYGRLRSLQAGSEVYERLKSFFQEADEKYNSGLFHFHSERGRSTPHDELTPSLSIDDKPLKDIFKHLYYPESPYEFSVISADILGQVYEQFLGKVIRLTPGGRAQVEDKPEVKKSGGVYYTPTFVVNHIIKSTLGRVLSGRTPATARGIRVLDPACGSGSFLLGAYQYLLDWYLDKYTAADPAKLSRGKRPQLFLAREGSWKLTTSERRRILVEHIYGVDIDAQAVEVTKLSLLLKVLETDSAESLGKSLAMFRERALPDLDSNIKCGNSLISTDYYAGTFADESVNAFDWSHEFPSVFEAGGFDVVIGNPPYDVLEKDRGKASWPHDALVRYVSTRPEYEPATGGKQNLFRFFIAKSLTLTKLEGRFGMIVPMALLADVSTTALRAHLLRSTRDLVADCFPQKDNANRRIFKRAKLSTVIVTGAVRNPARNKNPHVDVNVFPWDSFEDEPKRCRVSLRDAKLLDPESLPIPLVTDAELSVCKRLHTQDGIAALGQMSDFQVTRGEINQTNFRDYITSDRRQLRLVKGSEIKRFGVQRVSQGSQEWFNEVAFLRSNNPRPVVDQRRIALQRITGVDDTYRLIGTIIEPRAYFADSTNSIVASPDSQYSLEYLLAILNSRLMQWRFRLSSTNNNVSTGQLQALPIAQINFEEEVQRGTHDRLASQASSLLDLARRMEHARSQPEIAQLERRVRTLERSLDAMVYQLYGLSGSEIAVIEASLARPSQVSAEEQLAA